MGAGWAFARAAGGLAAGAGAGGRTTRGTGRIGAGARGRVAAGLCATGGWRACATGTGSAAITIEGDETRGRLSGLSITDAGPSRRDGVSRRPIAAVSVSAATAPCPQESLM
jgi:hypothetical protein